MSGIGGDAKSFFAFGVDIGSFHKTVNSLSGADKLFSEKLMQTVEAERWVLMMQSHQSAQKSLIRLFNRRWGTVEPSIITAAGDIEQSA